MPKVSDVLRFGNICVEEAVQARQELDTEFDSNYNFFIGKHWKTERASAPRPVTNYIFSTIRSSVALLTDNKPRLVCNPYEQEDIKKADIIKKGLWGIWNYNQCDDLLNMVITSAHIYGLGFLKVRFNPELRGVAGSKGEIEVSLVPTRYLYPSPDATNSSLMNFKPSYMLQRMPMTIDQIVSNYDNGDKVKPEGILSRQMLPFNIGSSFGREDFTSFKTEVGKTTIRYDGDKSEYQEVGEAAFVNELWHWDRDTNDYKVCIFTKDVVLKELGNPLSKGDIKFQRPPFVGVYNYWLENCFWGISEVTLLKSLQRDNNVLKAMIYDHLRLMGNSPIIADTNSDFEIENTTNAEGLVWWKNPNTEVRRESPVPLPPDAFKSLADNKYEIDTISGIHDVTQGRRPVGITAGVAINELQEAAQVPVRDKARRIQSALTTLGKIIFRNMQVFYNKDRVQKIVKGISGATEEENDGFSKTIEQQYGIKLEKTKQEIYDIKDIDGEYDMYFDVESGLGMTRSARINQALQYYSAGLVDRKAALELAFPNADDILKRMALQGAIDNIMKSGALTQLGQGGEAVAPAGGMPPSVTGGQMPA